MSHIPGPLLMWLRSSGCGLCWAPLSPSIPSRWACRLTPVAESTRFCLFPWALGADPQGKDGRSEQECEKCSSSLTFLKVKQQVDIITNADVWVLAVTRAQGK
ncbi:unnamed protein product [Pleuronectes platessa]|uniref:Secreted protein n=1 Tax=Pleuronectes platessa TaxID=8262 RepID=A0A9N7UP14_PLEPL|nr:unnamed protein product [Pleuronectes platessa]